MKKHIGLLLSLLLLAGTVSGLSIVPTKALAQPASWISGWHVDV